MSQANWSPTTGLNLSKRLHTQNSHPRTAPMASPAAWPLIPQNGQPRVDPGSHPNAINFGSLQFDYQDLRPLSPFQGRPNTRMSQSRGPHSSMAPESQWSPERRVTYSHATYPPALRAQDDYNSLLMSRCSDPAVSSAGEHESLRRLLVDSDEEPVTPGHPREHLIPTRRLPNAPPSATTSSLHSTPTPATGLGCFSGSKGVIRKVSPVKHRRERSDDPRTRNRYQSLAPGDFDSDSDVVELDELDVREEGPALTGHPSPITPTPPGPFSRSTTKAIAGRSTRGRKSRGNRTAETVSNRSTHPVVRSPRTALAITPTRRFAPPAGQGFAQPLSSAVTPAMLVGERGESAEEDRSPGDSNSTRDTSSQESSSPTEPISTRKTVSPNPATGRFRWPDQPGQLDVLWLSFLASTSPFEVAKETAEKFRQCAETLTTHPDTRRFFENMSTAKHSYTLRNRYEMLKRWLAKAESKSRADSGTQEEDGDLRKAIKALAIQEEELKSTTNAAKVVKEGAAIALAKANQLRDARAFRTQSGSPRNRPDDDEAGEDDHVPNELGKRGPTSLRALRDGLLNKLSGSDSSSTHMVNVTLKSSEAAEKANELTRIALERYQEQTAVINMQRERELAQSQARLDLDAQTARETIALRREELQAAGAREDKKDGSIIELKTSMASVQGTLADMGSVLKMLADRLPATNGSN